MRILITASTLPRWRGDAIPGFVLDQALALRRLHPELEIHILAPHDRGAAAEETWEGIRIRRFRYFWPPQLARLTYPAILPNLQQRPWLVFEVPFLFLAEFLAVCRLVLRSRPALIYSHWFTPQAVVGAAVARLFDIPHVFTSHASDVQVMRWLPAAGPALVRAITRSVRACTVTSRRTLDKLREFFPDAAQWAQVAPKVLTLPMGVDCAVYRPLDPAPREVLRAKLGLSGAKVILFMGRLTAKKGIDVLLDAFATEAARRNDLLLVIAGEGELRAAIERQVAALHLGDRVRMPGYLTGAHKLAYLQAADVFVVPSVIAAGQDAEGLPVALLEGLAAGRICIATDVSGADDILQDGSDGFLVPQRDVAALARALGRAASLAEDEAHAMGARARRRAEVFDWPIVAEAHYRHLLFASADLRERT
jgi:glycosyltransferase involved in cell wall biosynthesis